MKIGSETFTPLWFTALRLMVATVAIFVIVGAMRDIRLPKKGDLKAVLVIGGLQMALFLVFAHIGIEHIHASQANILCYATPLFVVPIGLLVFGEKPTKLGWTGVAFCLAGVILLFSPWNYDWHHREAWVASLLLLLSAGCWAISILYMRHGRWHSPLLTLQLWQAAFATVICLALALIWEGLPVFSFTAQGWGVLLFTGAISGALGQWSMNRIQRQLHPLVASSGYLAIPAATLILCFFLLGESLHGAKIADVALIVAGSILCSKSHPVHSAPPPSPST